MTFVLFDAVFFLLSFLIINQDISFLCVFFLLLLVASLLCCICELRLSNRAKSMMRKSKEVKLLATKERIKRKKDVFSYGLVASETLKVAQEDKQQVVFACCMQLQAMYQLPCTKRTH